MVFLLTSPMPSFMMQNEMNVICISIICPFTFPKCIYLCSTNDSHCFLTEEWYHIFHIYGKHAYIFGSSFLWISLFLYFVRSWQFDLGACCFPEHNHFHNILSYMFSNQLHYVGGTTRNEVWDGSRALLKFCDMLVHVAPQTSNGVKRSAYTQRKNIRKSC